MDQCPKCKSKNIVMIEYAWPHPEHYDGISEYSCRDCGYRQGRWSGKELAEGEAEKRYGIDRSEQKGGETHGKRNQTNN